MNRQSRCATGALSRTLLAAPLSVLLVGAPVLAQETAPEASKTEDVVRAAQAERQAAEARATAAFAQALQAAEVEQRAALEAVEAARRELAQRAEYQERSREEYQQRIEESRGRAEEARELAREVKVREREENRRIREELERAHENLRRASREVARVHREINREESGLAPMVRFGPDHAVIGVILGESTEEGVRVLGVSPDGPAERAGLQQGDVIVSLMGESLGGDGVDGRSVLGEGMASVESGDELAVVVERDGERIEYAVTAEERTPFSWHSVTRLSTVPVAPGAPDAPVIVQSIEVPKMDRERLERELEGLREELERRHIVIDTQKADGDDEIRYEFETFSGVADAALAGTSIWFGMPLTRGLKLTELADGLGEYFGTDRGVLVIEAREDNALQLRPGDVILSVGGDEVRRPADVVRALRDVETGDSLDIEIKRRQRDETLSVVISENRVGFHEGPGGAVFEFDWRGSVPGGWELHRIPDEVD